MSRRRRCVLARVTVAACALATVSAIPAPAKEIAPYRVALDVHWGHEAGSDAFRDDLARSLGSTLGLGCFSGVALAGTDPSADQADVVFDVALSDVVDETRFDDSIAGALQPGEPSKELRRVTYFEVTVDARLTVRASGTLIQKKHMVARESRRPVYVGENPQLFVRADAIQSIVRELTRALGCGSAKLSKKIREASGGPPSASPAPR